MHTGCQWKKIPITKNEQNEPKMHYTRVFRVFQRWVENGCFKKIFIHSVEKLFKARMLKSEVIFGDGTATCAKKGGDNLGRNGHKHHKGDKIVAFCDDNCNVLAPFVTAPGNKHESPLLCAALKSLIEIAKEIGMNLASSIISLDGAYDSRDNRKAIFNHGMKPNIKENPRNKKEKRGRKKQFCKEIHKRRFETIERVWAWEDKFKRLLTRFEFKSENHYGLKYLGYGMINLRHFCA